MALYKKGQGGRPKGVLNKKTRSINELKVDTVLSAKGVKPIEEILKLLPLLEPRDQVKTYLELQQYIQGKVRVVEVVDGEKNPESYAAQMPTADLLQIVQAG